MKLFYSIFLIFISSQFAAAQNCEALFTTDGNDITVKFTDLSSSNSGDPIVSWFWDFDDNGNTSTLQNPTYTFSEPGSYDVELEITTQNGCTADYKLRVRTCVLNVNYSLGQCDNSGLVSLSLTINDIYDSAEQIDVILDGQSLAEGPFIIGSAMPVSINLSIPGDGLVHELLVTSLEREGCTSSVSFSVPDCGSDCFLSSINIDYPEGVVHNVSIGDNFFNPSSVGITLGDIVRFNWVDGGHSTTSDVSTGVDAWNSGILNAGSSYDVQVLNPGTHRYYCIPHGGPGGIGMSGSILANCPTGTTIDILVKFRTSQANPQGFNIKFDGAFIASGPFSYMGTGEQSQLITIAGDGNAHQIEIVDVADPSCTISTEFVAPDCDQGGGDPVCTLDFSIGTPSECLSDGTVNVPITVMVENGGAGFNVSINGSTFANFQYAGPHTAITLNLPGDGNTSSISISDNTKTNCIANKSFTSPDCSLPCGITQLSAMPISSGGSAITHIVNVEDFQFNPSIINIAEGDFVRWEWTGDIPHSTTSDVTSGANSWDSGIIGKGASFQSPELPAGEHPYYCIPHGGPGGQGMAGKVIVLPACNADEEVSVQVNFNITSKRGATYEVKVDGISIFTNPYGDGVQQEVVVLVKGDGLSHNIEIIDSEFPTCNENISIITSDCSGEEAICEISLDVGVPETCINGVSQVTFVINAINQGDSLELSVDGSIVGQFPYEGASTIVSVALPGDGQPHLIAVKDLLNTDCIASIEVTSNDCSLPCNIDNLTISALGNSNGGTIHTVFVEDFQFSPREIEIVEGDQIEWVWTGNIPHTTTSDATEGPDSWRSELLGNGATFTSPVLSLGSHPYYCEPHGGPGGEGMAGVVNVVPECSEELNAAYLVRFQIASQGSAGYSIFIDDLAIGTFGYNEGADQEQVIEIPGDGLLHTVVIRDNEKSDCAQLASLISKDCNPESCVGLTVDFELDIDYSALQVTLSNESIGAFQEAIWDFGDGNTSNEENPVYQYQDTGTYNICLTLIDQDNCSSLHCEEVVISNEICEALFEYNRSGDNYVFYNKSKVASAEYNFSWSIDGGDPIANLDSFEYVFSNGVFEVCLSVEEGGCSSSYCEVFDLSDVCAFVQSAFSFEVNVGSGLSVQFNDESNGIIDSWLWGFGDGSTSRDSIPSHEYENPGTYNVCLLVGNDENNCLSSSCQEVQVLSTGIEEISPETGIKLRPNPQFVGQSILLSLSNRQLNSDKVLVQIFSVDGREQFSATVVSKEEMIIPLQLEAGLYYVRVRFGNEVYTSTLLLI